MFTRAFFVDALERALRTAAQALIGVFAAGATGVLDVDWRAAGSAAGLAALVSLLTSVVASGVGIKGTAGLLPSKADASE
jgi:r1t holin